MRAVILWVAGFKTVGQANVIQIQSYFFRCGRVLYSFSFYLLHYCNAGLRLVSPLILWPAVVLLYGLLQTRSSILAQHWCMAALCSLITPTAYCRRSVGGDEGRGQLESTRAGVIQRQKIKEDSVWRPPVLAHYYRDNATVWFEPHSSHNDSFQCKNCALYRTQLRHESWLVLGRISNHQSEKC